MAHVSRYSKYKDVQQKRVLRKDIADMTPYDIKLPDPPKVEDMINFGKPVEEQFFVREKIPDWVWKLTSESQKKEKGKKSRRNEIFTFAKKNREYTKFIEEQWEKRKNGVWMYIFGTPYWFPGSFWFYLNYYPLPDVGLPNFRYVDLEYWWWWVLCVEEGSDVYGGIEFTQRRDGKSFRMMCNIFEKISRTLAGHAGLQSKTREDADQLFDRGAVGPWRKQPFFFLPAYDGRPYPKKELVFRDSSSDALEESTTSNTIELNSSIITYPTVVMAQDGTKKVRIGLDEMGKTEEIDAYDLWRVIKQCLRVQQAIVGKAMVTTTVEETTRYGLASFKKLWDESDHDPEKLAASGQTVSGLIRYFKSAYETFTFDQYGYSIIEDPKDYQIKWRKEKLEELQAKGYKDAKIKVLMGFGAKDYMKGGIQLVDEEINSQPNPVERQKTIRMYPRNIREAFRKDTKDCEFGALGALIDERLDDFLFAEKGAWNETERGNLSWKDDLPYHPQENPNAKVEWKPNPDGRWLFTKALLPYLIANANNVRVAGNKLYPGNKAMGLIGADPYKQNAKVPRDFLTSDRNKTSADRKSLGTAHGYIGLIPELDLGKDEEDMVTDDLFMEYGYRWPSKEKYGQDMIMTCYFLGMPLFPEINVTFLQDYFVSQGLEEFLFYRTKLRKKTKGSGVLIEESKTPGMTTLGAGMQDGLFSYTGAYLERNVRRCKFYNFLMDCKDVEFQELNPYDFFVSGSYSIFGYKSKVKRPQMEEPKEWGNLVVLGAPTLVEEYRSN